MDVNIEPGTARINCHGGSGATAWPAAPFRGIIPGHSGLTSLESAIDIPNRPIPNRRVEHDELEAALRRCGATWNASQSHGFLCSRIAVRGTGARAGWLKLVTGDAEKDEAPGADCTEVLEALFTITWLQLAERQSAFVPLLPEDGFSAAERADALAHWCEGFLHGLVSGPHPETLRAQLGTAPLSDIIKDMLEITRATADDDLDDEANEEAYVELVEYIRVAAQLTFEELAGFRAQGAAEPDADAVH